MPTPAGLSRHTQRPRRPPRHSLIPIIIYTASIAVEVNDVACRMLGVPWSMSAHAKDIHLSESSSLRKKMAAARFTSACTRAHQQLLTELATTQSDGSVRDPHQIELFGTLLTELQAMQRRPVGEVHRVKTAKGVTYAGTWEEIVLQMKMDDRDGVGSSLQQYMERVAQRSRAQIGAIIPIHDARAFVEGVAAAGLLRILR